MSALLTRVRKFTAWNAEAIVCHIFTELTLDKIRQYVDGSDEGIHTLIGKIEKRMMPKAQSPGREFLAPSWRSQSQSQSSDTFDRTQAASTGQIGTSQLHGSSSAPDDGMRDCPDPSWNSQGQSSGTSVGFQSAPTGQIVTSQIPDDKSTGLKEHSQSSSVPGCSDVTGCLPSSSRPWPDTCHYYISTRGLCKKGLSCRFSHGFGPSGKLEMEIRQLLRWISCPAVFIEDLTWIYFERYKKHLPVESIWDPRSLPSLLRSLHTICLVPDSYGQHCLVLLDHYQAYMGYSTDLWAREVLKEEGPNQIYIGFSPASRSIFTSENVYHYFSQYGPVLSVNIPYQSTYGFVRFQYAGTVRLLLSEWNPRVPHFIFGAAVWVRRYIPKGEAKRKNTDGKHVLENGCDPGIVTEKSSGTSAAEIAPPLTHSQPSQSQMEIDPLEGGNATDDSADHSQPSHSQVEIDHPEGGQVPDGLEINPVEGGQVADGLEINPVGDGHVPGGLDGNPADEEMDDEIVLGLPDAGCFYKQS